MKTTAEQLAGNGFDLYGAFGPEEVENDNEKIYFF